MRQTLPRPFRRAGCRVPRERLDQPCGGTSVQDNGRDRKEQCLYVFQPDFSDYCHLSDPCRFVPGSYVSAGHHREHADRYCTGDQGEKDAGKLSVLNAPKATAIRDGAEVTLAAEDLVLDDIVVFTAGKQICADAVVLEGEVQVNESLLTGESDEITKRPGDELMSGSFIVSGSCKSV